MLDSLRRVVVFFLFFEPSGLPRPRGLRAVVVSPPDVGIRDGNSMPLIRFYCAGRRLYLLSRCF
jgi:hypothetical protein